MGSWGSRTIVRQSGFINKLRTMNMGLACIRLGMIYENGMYDIEINLEEALKWYRLLQTKIMTGRRNVWTVLKRLFRMLLKTADRKTPPIYTLYASS